MMEDYETGDPDLVFGRRAGSVPRGATKATHPNIRSQLKVALGLGAMYGAGPQTVSLRTGQPEPYAREMLQLHRDTYPCNQVRREGDRHVTPELTRTHDGEKCDRFTMNEGTPDVPEPTTTCPGVSGDEQADVPAPRGRCWGHVVRRFCGGTGGMSGCP